MRARSIRLLDASLLATWLLLAGAGLCKGVLRLHVPYEVYQRKVQAWLALLPVPGVVLALGIGVLCLGIARACVVHLRPAGCA